MALTDPYRLSDMHAQMPPAAALGQRGVGLASVQADPNITPAYNFPLVARTGMSFTYPGFGVDPRTGQILPPSNGGGTTTPPATNGGSSDNNNAGAGNGAGQGDTGGGAFLGTGDGGIGGSEFQGGAPTGGGANALTPGGVAPGGTAGGGNGGGTINPNAALAASMQASLDAMVAHGDLSRGQAQAISDAIAAGKDPGEAMSGYGQVNTLPGQIGSIAGGFLGGMTGLPFAGLLGGLIGKTAGQAIGGKPGFEATTVDGSGSAPGSGGAGLEGGSAGQSGGGPNGEQAGGGTGGAGAGGGQAAAGLEGERSSGERSAEQSSGGGQTGGGQTGGGQTGGGQTGGGGVVDTGSFEAPEQAPAERGQAPDQQPTEKAPDLVGEPAPTDTPGPTAPGIDQVPGGPGQAPSGPTTDLISGIDVTGGIGLGYADMQDAGDSRGGPAPAELVGERGDAERSAEPSGGFEGAPAEQSAGEQSAGEQSAESGGGPGETGGGNENWRGGPVRITPLARVTSSGMLPSYAGGGPVQTLGGPNPPNPDDGFGSLQRGEFVVNAPAAHRYGGILDQINDGTFDPEGSVGDTLHSLENMPSGDGSPLPGMHGQPGGMNNLADNMPQTGGTPSSPAMGSPGFASPGPDQGGTMDADGDYDGTMASNPLMGDVNPAGITPDSAMQNLAQLDPSQRMVLQMVATDPNASGALLQVLGPAFMPVLAAMGAQPTPAVPAGGPPMPGPPGNGDSGMGMPASGPAGGPSVAPPGVRPRSALAGVMA